jgi:formylglycine-generating enzyme
MHVLLAAFALTALAQAPYAIEDLDMGFVPIEAGSFTMGADEGDWDERPTHTVEITQPFHMALTEVTNAQYEAFAPAHRALRGKQGLSTEDDEAVCNVSWEEATAFCAWLSKREGKTYRLPTEAEWEYACRAGADTPFHTGEKLSGPLKKNQKECWNPDPVALFVGRSEANAFGLHDMHGNVEEWCHDWYGPYRKTTRKDPIGYAAGDFRVSRGGSHGTAAFYLRSANRMGTLPKDKHWYLGFRVVQGELPKTKATQKPSSPRWAQWVVQRRNTWKAAPDESTPYFEGPLRYVHIPPDSQGPMFSQHNHCPAITACPNGDLLAIWYSTRREKGRELGIVAARLRKGAKEWEPAAPFWDAPDRNDHASALLWDGEKTLFHLNGLGAAATWGELALILRTSTDNGATWSDARLCDPEHRLRNMPIAGVFISSQGDIMLPSDAATGGNGGSALNIGRNLGETWVEYGEHALPPSFKDGAAGAWIAGIHAGVVELSGGDLMAFGRGNTIKGRMPRSLSADGGKTWTYSPTPFPPVGGGQRLVLMRLQEGPIFFASFADSAFFSKVYGKERKETGLFGAISDDDGATWKHMRLITDGKPARDMDGGGNTRAFVMSPTSAEPRGYMAATQTPDGVIHLISSALHYRFNLKWLTAGETITPLNEK